MWVKLERVVIGSVDFTYFHLAIYLSIFLFIDVVIG